MDFRWISLENGFCMLPKSRVYHFSQRSIMCQNIVSIDEDSSGTHVIVCNNNGVERIYKFAQASQWTTCIEDRFNEQDVGE